MSEYIPTDFDPSAQNGLYETFEDDWTANRDFAEMHPHILTSGDYLDKFDAEEAASQYNWRKANALSFDCIADVINIRVSNLFRAAPTRMFDDSPYAKMIEAFLADVDGDGTSMDDFMRRAVRQQYVNGVDILVDREAIDGLPLNRAQESESRVYLQAFTPLERFDWSCSPSGAYSFARYFLGSPIAQGELDDTSGIHEYLTYDSSAWYRYRVEDVENKEPIVTVSTGPHILGQCPIVPFYFGRSTRRDFPGIPISLLTRLTPMARYLLNLTSQAELDLFLTVSFLVFFGVTDTEMDACQQMGPGIVWRLSNPDAKVDRIFGEVKHIAEKREWIKLIIEKMAARALLGGVLGEMEGRAESGVQVAVESGPLHNELCATATQAEEVEAEVMRIVLSRMVGKPLSRDEIGYSVQYNRKFMIDPLGDLVNIAKGIKELDLADDAPGLMRMILQRVTDQLGRQGDPMYEQTLAELADASFGGMAPVVGGG